MRSLVLLASITALLFTIASGGFVQAYVDFTGHAGPAKRSVHPITGNVHYEHDVHHVYEKSNTFFKASYKAEHEPHWNIVRLHEHISEEDLSESVHCGVGEKDEINRLTVKNPSKALLEQLQQQKSAHYPSTVITAHPKHKCKNRGIFRQLVDVIVANDDDGSSSSASSSVTLVVKSTSYNKIFKNLDLKIETDHVTQKNNNKQKNTAAAASSVPQIEAVSSARIPQKMSMKRHFLQHAMSTQSLWDRFKSACSHAVHTVATGCSDAAHDVAHAAETAGQDIKKGAEDAGNAIKKGANDVANAVSSFHVDHTFDLPGLNWNKDVTKSFSHWDMVTESASVAASFSFHPTVTFILQIERFHLSNLEAYFNGATSIGVTGNFDAKVSKSESYKKLITTIDIDSVDFEIGPVPVWLQPSVPIYAGFDANIDGDITVKAVLQATADVEFGFAYAPSTGHRTISNHDFKFVHDFGPMEYEAEIGLGVYVEPVLAINVESVGQVQVGARIQGDATVQSNNDCHFDLDLGVTPSIALNAGINIDLLDHSVWKDLFGPWTLWSTKVPLYSYCKPQTAQAKKDLNGFSSRGMEVQAHKRVTTTVEKEVTGHHIGKTWSGSSSTMQNGHTIQQTYGAQFSAGQQVNSSQLFFTISQSRKAPGQSSRYKGLLTSVATAVYTCPSLPKAGQTLNFTLVSTDAVANQTYNAASNKTVLSITPSKYLLWKVDAEDVRFVSLTSPMTYGTVELVAPAANNDTSSFTIFKNGGATLEKPMGFDKTDILAVLIYAGAATLFLILASVLAVVFYRKFNKARRSAVQANNQDKFASRINEEAAI